MGILSVPEALVWYRMFNCYSDLFFQNDYKVPGPDAYLLQEKHIFQKSQKIPHNGWMSQPFLDLWIFSFPDIHWVTGFYSTVSNCRTCALIFLQKKSTLYTLITRYDYSNIGSQKKVISQKTNLNLIKLLKTLLFHPIFSFNFYNFPLYNA